MSREIAPVIGAVVIASRAGSAIAAELGSMVVTQQVDALRSLAVNPIEYLVVPRMVAVIVMLPFLCVLALITGMYGGMLVAQSYGIPAAMYLDSIHKWVSMTDVWVGLIKTFPFATIIAIISCHQGLEAQGGAQGVGRAVTSTVVMCIVLIYAADYFLSSMLPQ
jgi:phospholipid/cholesterol/gamma-HCH transport system permease protein